MKDTSRNFTTCVVTLFIIGSVLFSAVESVRVQTKRVKGEYENYLQEMLFEHGPYDSGLIGTRMEVVAVFYGPFD